MWKLLSTLMPLGRQWKVSLAKAICFSFAVVEFIMAYYTNSAILAVDANYHLNDFSRMEPIITEEERNRMGTAVLMQEFFRALLAIWEIYQYAISAAFSLMFLAIGLFALADGSRVVFHPEQVLIMGLCGVVVNVICALLMKDYAYHGHCHKPLLKAHDPNHMMEFEDSFEKPTSWMTSARGILSRHIALDSLNNLAVILPALLMWQLQGDDLEAANAGFLNIYSIDGFGAFALSILLMVSSGQGLKQWLKVIKGLWESHTLHKAYAAKMNEQLDLVELLLGRVEAKLQQAEDLNQRVEESATRLEKCGLIL